MQGNSISSLFCYTPRMRKFMELATILYLATDNFLDSQSTRSVIKCSHCGVGNPKIQNYEFTSATIPAYLYFNIIVTNQLSGFIYLRSSDPEGKAQEMTLSHECFYTTYKARIGYYFVVNCFFGYNKPASSRSALMFALNLRN